MSGQRAVVGCKMGKSNPNKNMVTLKIDGDNITAEAFSNSVRTFFEIIEDVTASVTGKRKAIEWIISVVPGSIGLCATPKPKKVTRGEVTKTVKTIGRGIEAISKRRKPSQHFRQNTLEKIYHMGNIVGLGDKGISQISIQANGKPHDISPSSVSYVSDILKTPTMAYGTIEGYLHAIDLKGRVHFGIDEILTNKRVKCFFGSEIESSVLSAIKKRVSAYGLIRYKRGGVPASVEISELTVFPEQSDLPQFKDLIGLYKD